jgi:hypothetical protein
MKKNLDKKFVDFFISKENVKIRKKDGERFILLGSSLEVFDDPITGRDLKGRCVKIYRSEIEDIASAF